MFSPWMIIKDEEKKEPHSTDPWAAGNSILAGEHPAVQVEAARRLNQLWSLPPDLAARQCAGSCIPLRGTKEGRLTLSWRILSSASLSEKCSTLVSCRSISVSHTRMLSLVPSNSSLWLVKCCKGEESHIYADGT